MAIDWISGAGLFDKLGKLVAAATGVDTAGSGSSDMLVKYNAFIAKLTETTDQAFLGSVISARDGMRTAIAGQNQSITGVMQNFLNGEIITQEALGVNKTLSDLWTLMRYYMGRDAKAVRENLPTIGGSTETTATPQSSPFTNTGDPTIALTIKGVNAAMTVTAGATVATDCTKAATHPVAQTNEVVLPDSYEFKVTRDASNGASSGNETIQVEGSKLTVSANDYDWKHAGSRGNISVVSSVAGGSKISNGGFESTTGSGGTLAFPNWTYTVGAAATNFTLSTSDKLRGSNAVAITASLAVSPNIRQQITGLKAKTKYLVAVAAKKTANGTGAGATFTVQITASGWTPHASEKISKTTVSGGTLATSWTRLYFWINTPDVVPDTVYLDITVNEGTGGYASVLVDEVLVIEPTPFADGLYAAAMANATDPRLNDRWTLSVTNAMPGLFQTFIGRFFGVLLPSCPNGTTGQIDEALAS